MQTSITHTIGLIAGHPTHIGYHYLALAVSIALRDGYPARGLTTVLYPQIAVVTESTPTNVSLYFTGNCSRTLSKPRTAAFDALSTISAYLANETVRSFILPRRSR